MCSMLCMEDKKAGKASDLIKGIPKPPYLTGKDAFKNGRPRDAQNNHIIK